MKYTIILLIILSAFNVKAQDNTISKTVNRLSFDYGKNYNLKLDKTYSRVAKSGFNHQFNLGYEKLNPNHIFSLKVNFMIGKLNTRGVNTDSYNTINNYAGQLNFRYLKKLQLKNKISVFIGGHIGFRSDIWIPTEALAYGWDSNLDAGFSGAVFYKINSKFTVRYDLDLPLLGVLWRSHNNGQQLITEEVQLEKGLISSVFETPRFSNPFNAFYVDNSFKLYYSISNKIDLYYNLNISYRSIKQPLVKKGYDIGNAIGINYNF